MCNRRAATDRRRGSVPTHGVIAALALTLLVVVAIWLPLGGRLPLSATAESSAAARHAPWPGWAHAAPVAQAAQAAPAARTAPTASANDARSDIRTTVDRVTLAEAAPAVAPPAQRPDAMRRARERFEEVTERVATPPPR